MNPHTEISKTQVRKFKYPKDLPKRYKQYLISANNKGIKFEFSIEEFEKLISKDCNYCGKSNSQGLDKINPKGNYVFDNVVPCCSKCNTMKFVYSTEDFLNHVKRIYKFNNP
jgi:5-methylcytosine-specific restriction endonuclease McrA